MTKLEAIANHAPFPVAALLCSALVATIALEKVDLPDWLTEDPDHVPEQPAPAPLPVPKSVAVPYAPAPGRDDRTPVAYLSQVFDLGDGALPSKLSGIGPVFWDHAGQGSRALIAPNIVLTTGHLFAEKGKWEGPHGPTEKPPAPSDRRIYLDSLWACL
jgi:V8-like Glu-specific endopeptidase